MNRHDCRGALETKSAEAGDDLGGAFEEFMISFEAFKEANDRRLAEIERRAAADARVEAGSAPAGRGDRGRKAHASFMAARTSQAGG